MLPRNSLGRPTKSRVLSWRPARDADTGRVDTGQLDANAAMQRLPLARLCARAALPRWQMSRLRGRFNHSPALPAAGVVAARRP
eukprot:2872699-Prymnesium_polylepis.3